MFNSSLFDENSFYKAFLKDLDNAQGEVYIESPFITSERAKKFRSIFEELINKDIKVYVLTRFPDEQDDFMQQQAENEISYFENIGVQVFLAQCENQKMFHRKLAIIDRKILWEGSLNILSQTHSREFMRRIEDKDVTLETLNFLRLHKVL